MGKNQRQNSSNCLRPKAKAKLWQTILLKTLQNITIFRSRLPRLCRCCSDNGLEPLAELRRQSREEGRYATSQSRCHEAYDARSDSAGVDSPKL